MNFMVTEHGSLEDQIMERVQEAKVKQKEVTDLWKEIAELASKASGSEPGGYLVLGHEPILPPVPERPVGKRFIKPIMRDAVLMTVQRQPGLEPSEIWPVIEAMGVVTKNPRPNKAVSMALQDLKKDGFVTNREDGWYPVGG